MPNTKSVDELLQEFYANATAHFQTVEPYNFRVKDINSSIIFTIPNDKIRIIFHRFKRIRLANFKGNVSPTFVDNLMII